MTQALDNASPAPESLMPPLKKHFPVDKICKHCGKTFHAVSRYAVTKQEFCDRTCRSQFYRKGQFKPRVERACLKCGKVMQLLPNAVRANRRFCSYSCGNGYTKTGEDNPAWKGGNSYFWKQKARERDNFMCRFTGCGFRDEGKRTHAHHMIPKAAGGPDTLNNLVTLCEKHHRAVEGQLLQALVEKFPEIVRDMCIAIFGNFPPHPPFVFSGNADTVPPPGTVPGKPGGGA